MEGCHTLQGSVELLDLARSDTTILSEQEESFRIVVETLKVDKVLVDWVESFLLRSCSEKNASISSLDGILDDGGLMVWGTINLIDRSDAEGTEELL